MWTRRQFLSRSSLAALGTAGTCFALPGDNRGNGGLDSVPDGSASKGMITAKTDDAIENGLAYLNARAHGDGSFGTHGYQGNVAVTSLAALAFMAHGDMPNRGPCGRIITNALKFILKQENREGRHEGYLHNPQASPHGPMYGHGFATLFLAEASGQVHDKSLRKELNNKLHLAVKLILDSQNLDGGWRYTPDSPDADISVTICQIMALRAARNAGISVPKSKVDKCVEYVKSCQDRRQGYFRYMKQGGGGGGAQGFARTAAGVCALYSAGIYKGPEIELGLEFLRRSRPMVGNFGRPDMHYFYGHYYAVQAMWTAGGHYWSEWYPAIRDELVSRQASDGSWMDQICNHYATAMACIILQVPNNYLPILQK
ncbi:MAG TPA: prenyltransferase/squalene oxidase repeat-containing protein [Gemmataceae bacterium]|nr:prenyltransferase/squalene oxidase repeat-containing protein [Gemmataceae bacterium]